MLKYGFFSALFIVFFFTSSFSKAVTPNFVSIAKKSLPAIVSISVSRPLKNELSRFYDPLEKERFINQQLYSTIDRPKVKFLGSGFITSKDGYVVTNSHVVDGLNNVIITTNDGKEYKAKVIGKDIRTDIALLKIIKKEKGLGYPHLDFSNAKKNIEVGEWILAIGNPFGLGGSVTAGIVSSRSRDIASQAFDLEVASYVGNLIQTDASINVGNSGGPMLNTQGKIIGVNFAILSPSGSSIGVGFAIPSSVVQKVIKQLKNKGYVTYGWLGIQVQEVTEEIAQSVGMKFKNGAIIISLVKEGPGKKGGLQEGDIILKAGNTFVDSYEKFPRISGNLPVNKTSVFTIWSQGKEKKLSIFIEEIPRDNDESTTQILDYSNLPKRLEKETILGMELSPLRPEKRLNLGIPDHVNGLSIESIIPFSLAEKADLRRQDILMEVEGEPTLSIHSLQLAIQSAKDTGKKAILAKINRRGEKAYKGIALPENSKSSL